MFKIKELSERASTDAMNLQVEKLKRKQKILLRKKKMERVETIQHMIDDLMSSLKIRESQTKLKQLGAKFLDCLLINAEPLQVYCIELQLIPSLGVGRRLPFDVGINGTVIVYEKAKTETEIMIKYKAHIVPQPQRILDAVLVHSVNVEPSSLDFGQVYVHEAIKRKLTVTNVSNTQQNIWFSANSSSDAIITTKFGEYFLKYNESIEIPYEIFFIQPGRIVKEINITTQTSSQKIQLTAQCCYHDVLSFSGLIDDTIDYQTIPLTSLRILEERKVFTVTNITDNNVYVYIQNKNTKDILIYEKDPKAPLIKPFCLQSKHNVLLNVLLKPEIDRESYHNYKSTVIDEQINITCFETEEEASAFSALNSDDPDCIFQKIIKIKAIIGRIGLLTSDTFSLFKCVSSSNEQIDMKMTIKNRSTHIPITVIASAVQGLSLSDYVFNLEGRKSGTYSHEFSLTYSPSSLGINEAQIRFTTNGNQSYSKSVTISAFVDPKLIKTNLGKHDNGSDLLNIGGIYVQNGKPIFQDLSFEVTNISNIPIRFEIQELQKKFFLRQKETTKVTFQFPFSTDFYNPQEPDFSYRMFVYNFLTKQVIKVIYLVGYFSTSIGILDHDSISFERFGEVNHWIHKKEFCCIVNQSKIPLHLHLVSTPNYVDVPTEIGPIENNGKYELEIIPKIDELRNVEGEVNTQIRYINTNNISNILIMNVSFNISASFIRLEQIDSFKWLSFSALPSKAIKDFKDIEGELVSSTWFSVVSTMDVETTVNLCIDLLRQDDLTIELFGRASGRPLQQLVLQPNERFEIRIKVTMKQGKKLDEKDPYLADIVFEHDGSESLSMPLVYSPTDETNNEQSNNQQQNSQQ